MAYMANGGSLDGKELICSKTHETLLSDAK